VVVYWCLLMFTGVYWRVARDFLKEAPRSAVLISRIRAIEKGQRWATCDDAVSVATSGVKKKLLSLMW
jgi:hypothetical protein